MESIKWTELYIIITSVIGFYLLLKKGLESKQLHITLFSVALIPLIILNSIIVFNIEVPRFDLVQRWIQLTSLIFIFSGLLEFIREAKPKFSKFPILLILTPFLTLLIFPLAVNVLVITNMLFLAYQAGSIVVALLLFGLNQYKTKDSLTELLSIVVLGVSFILYWFIDDSDFINSIVVSKILLGIGIVLFSTAIKTKTNNEQSIKQ